MGSSINKLVKASSFGKIDLDPKTPKLPKAKTMPDPDDQEAKKAASRALQRKKRSGRTATVLTGTGSNTLG